jgi:hypothetical protein
MFESSSMTIELLTSVELAALKTVIICSHWRNKIEEASKKRRSVKEIHDDMVKTNQLQPLWNRICCCAQFDTIRSWDY